MHRILWIESAVDGVLMVNGCFCGPVDAQGQAFPAAEDAEIYIQLFPFQRGIQPLTVALELKNGGIEQLHPKESAYALIWPDGVIQLELRADGEDAQAQAEAVEVAPSALLRYLTLRLAGDERAAQLQMRPQDRISLPDYDAVVPLRFSPLRTQERFDERAGLVRRLEENVARVDTALAITSPAGQGHRLIERIEIVET
ncbi:MAG TPA: hypothetical protein IAC49_03045 [Candidatus Ventricola intestinavium]|nr:hypothetical protein [Candidatus Ventricola intestinavium]